MHQSVTARSNRVRRALSHRQARQHVPAGHVVWVYAITDSLAPGQLAGLTGVGAEQVRAVTAAGLTAVVGSVDEQAFGEQARAGLMSDLPSIERLGVPTTKSSRAWRRTGRCCRSGWPLSIRTTRRSVPCSGEAVRSSR